MDEKLKILEMVEKKEISVEEGMKLMDALEDERIEIPEEAMEGIDIPNVDKEVSVNLTTVSTDIEVERADVDKFEVMFFNTKTKELVEKPEWININATEDSLSIGTSKSGKSYNGISGLMDLLSNGIRVGSTALTAKIQIPRNFGTDLKVTTVSGNVEINKLSGSKCYIKTVSGDVNMVNSQFQVHELFTTSGDVNSNAMTGIIEAKSVSGDFDIVLDSGFKANNSNVKTVSGDVDINAGDDVNLEVVLDSVSGDIRSKYPGASRDKQGHRKSTIVIGDGSHKIFVKSVSGDVTIKEK